MIPEAQATQVKPLGSLSPGGDGEAGCRSGKVADRMGKAAGSDNGGGSMEKGETMFWRRLTALGCAFVVPVSANLFASAFWDRLANLGGTPALSHSGTAVTLVASLAAFVITLRWLYRNRHRILDHRALFSPEPVEARPVLITGLSDLRGPQPDVAGSLLERVRRERVPMGDLACLAPEVTDNFGAEVARLPWIQNIRAIWSHRARIERVIVVPSAQSQDQFARFRELVQALVENTPELAARGIVTIAVGQEVDFGDYNAIQEALSDALRQARESRAATPGETPPSLARRWRRAGRPPAYTESDISVDVTPGTKQFSIVAAIASFGPEGRFLYVDNVGMPRSYNISLRLAGGLIGD